MYHSFECVCAVRTIVEICGNQTTPFHGYNRYLLQFQPPPQCNRSLKLVLETQTMQSNGFGGYLNRQLSKVLPLQQSHKRLRRVLQSLHNIFAIFDLPPFEPFRHLLPELAKV